MSAKPLRRADATTAVLPEADRAKSGKAAIAEPRAGHEGFRAGDTVGRKYQLVRVLGQGGMGAVWLAHNTTLDADVAVKLIRREKATPAAAARLLQEAKLAARLAHPSIVRIFDFGTTDEGDPFIVMELLHGESLAQLIERKGRLPPVRAVQVLLPVVAGLQAAHAKGVVHRDLKPDNIFLSEQPTGTTPKVVDFGIAKLQDAGASGSLTQTGAVLGSPDYMSPEQARGRSRIDERTDVWGLSVVLYECVTGIAPFQGYNYNALLSAIIEDDPTPIGDLGVRDAGLWTVVKRGLAKRPEDRFQSARDLGRALVEWLHTQDVTTDITGATLVADWGSERRPLSEPLATSQLGPGVGDDATEVEVANDSAVRHAAIPPPPRLPAGDELTLPADEPAEEAEAPADESGNSNESSAANEAPADERGDRPTDAAAHARRRSRRATARLAIAVVLLGTLVAVRGWGLRRARPTTVAVPPGAATAIAVTPTAAATAPAETTTAPATTALPATPSELPTGATVVASAEPAASAPAVEPKPRPARPTGAGRPRKPGTMPLPAKPDF